MSIIAVLEFSLNAKHADEAAELLDKELEVTRAFDGCEGVQLLFGVDDPLRVLFVEKWASKEADDAYRAFRASERERKPSAMAELIGSMPTLTYYNQYS